VDADTHQHDAFGFEINIDQALAQHILAVETKVSAGIVKDPDLTHLNTLFAHGIDRSLGNAAVMKIEIERLGGSEKDSKDIQRLGFLFGRAG
jgi:hypothetical protein